MAVLESPESHISDYPSRFQQLTVADIGQVLRHYDDGLDQITIAQRLGVNQSTISRVLQKLGTDTTDIAGRLLKSRAYRSAVRVARIAEKGRNEDALKAAKLVFAASGVTKEDSGTPVNVAVVIGLPSAWAPDGGERSLSLESSARNNVITPDGSGS